MSSAVLDWQLRDEWLGAAERYASDVLSADVRAKLARTKKLDCWSDDLSWLPVERPVERFLVGFEAHYTHIRAFHACRPVGVEDFYKEGLLVQCPRRLEQNFRQLFADASVEQLDAAVQAVTVRGQAEPGRLWVCLNGAVLLRRGGHYLIQGGEYLTALTGNLRFAGALERLRRVGVPTMLELNIPLGDVPREQLMTLSKTILSEWGQEVTRRRLGGAENFSIVLRAGLPPSCIVGHFHPGSIPDPLANGRLFINTKTTCSACSN